eukprot:GFUD01086603.1.p1 GENE.GFUD01086603.1~~GFUD01086603.1.p1  ORF type:complete len:116 (-),score=19.15 GFUD01086603.1:64-411(-)
MKTVWYVSLVEKILPMSVLLLVLIVHQPQILQDTQSWQSKILSCLGTIKAAMQVLQVDTQNEHTGEGHLEDPQTSLKFKLRKEGFGPTDPPFTWLPHPGHFSVKPPLLNCQDTPP